MLLFEFMYYIFFSLCSSYPLSLFLDHLCHLHFAPSTIFSTHVLSPTLLNTEHLPKLLFLFMNSLLSLAPLNLHYDSLPTFPSTSLASFHFHPLASLLHFLVSHFTLASYHLVLSLPQCFHLHLNTAWSVHHSWMYINPSIHLLYSLS